MLGEELLHWMTLKKGEMDKEKEPYSEIRYVIELTYIDKLRSIKWWQFKRRSVINRWRRDKLRELDSQTCKFRGCNKYAVEMGKCEEHHYLGQIQMADFI